MKIKLTYIEHSGFLCETDGQYLLFDYFKGEIPPMPGTKPIFVFASHAHYDHFSEEVFRLSEQYGRQRVQYVLSSDIDDIDDIQERLGDRITFMKPHEKQIFACGDGGSVRGGKAGVFKESGINNACAGSPQLFVETLRSNDAGVAWLLNLGGKYIYHAGDLQLWDWPGEPEADNLHYKNTFEAELRVLKSCLGADKPEGRANKPEGRADKPEGGAGSWKAGGIDLAMLVLDERQGQSAFLGIDYFLSHIRTHYAVPMHGFGHYTLYSAYQAHIKELQERGSIPQSAVYLPPDHAGQTFELII